MRAGIFASGYVVVGGGGPIVGAYQTNAYDETDRSTYTFTSQAIGTASSVRRVVVAVLARHGSGVTLSSVTIGGISAAVHIDHVESTGNNHVAIASAVVPTGTTANVVVTFSATTVRCAIGVWTITGAASSFVASATGAETDPTNVTVTTQTDDFVIAGVASEGNTDFVWTGATERFLSDTPSSWFEGADVVASGASTSIDIDVAGTDITAAGAAFRAD